MKLNRIDGRGTRLSKLTVNDYFEYKGEIFLLIDNSSDIWCTRRIGYDYHTSFPHTKASETNFHGDREVHKVQILSLDYKRV